MHQHVQPHQIGRAAAQVFSFIPKLNLDLVTGVCFVVIAVLMALGVTLPLSGD